MNDDIWALQNRLKKLDEERSELIKQITKIQDFKAQNNLIDCVGIHAFNKTPETPEEKRQLFLSLFRCRKDVYPKRWDNVSQNKKGYSPVCQNEWDNKLCKKNAKNESLPAASYGVSSGTRSLKFYSSTICCE